MSFKGRMSYLKDKRNYINIKNGLITSISLQNCLVFIGLCRNWKGQGQDLQDPDCHLVSSGSLSNM